MPQHYANSPAPREGYKARKITSKRGGSVDPHDATARFTGPKSRGTWPKDNPPTPEGTQARFTGDSQANDLSRGETQVPKAWEPSGDSRTMQNPLR